jgi:Bacterial HORMA domain family 1
MSSTSTQTTTYTVADIRKVVDNFAADFSMMAQATGLRTRESVALTVSDLKVFAEYGYLVEVTLFLFDQAGNKIRAALYKVAQSAAGWVSDRPGNNLWPKTEGGSLWVLATLNEAWGNKSTAERQAFVRDRGLNYPWATTDRDTSLNGLATSAGQKYASNGYGWERTNYGQ